MEVLTKDINFIAKNIVFQYQNGSFKNEPDDKNIPIWGFARFNEILKHVEKNFVQKLKIIHNEKKCHFLTRTNFSPEEEKPANIHCEIVVQFTSIQTIGWQLAMAFVKLANAAGFWHCLFRCFKFNSQSRPLIWMNINFTLVQGQWL